MLEYPADIQELPNTGVSAIYVDTENLTPPAGGDDIDFAQGLISRIVTEWPDGYPPIGLLTLYVTADKTSQWRIWANDLLTAQTTHMPASESSPWRLPAKAASERGLVRVRGVQRFSRNGSKNSADMAIVLDVFDDLLLSKRADFSALISNDSDFYSLFDKLHEVLCELGHPVSKIPLLWIVAPNGNNLSPEIKRFLSPQFVWDLSDKSDQDHASSLNREVASALTTVVHEVLSSEADTDQQFNSVEIGNVDDMVRVLERMVSEMTENQHYRASELHGILKMLYPTHQLSVINTASFGKILLDNVSTLRNLDVATNKTSNTARYVRK